MRVVAYVEHLEFEFEGNIVKNAICLGDVDNDGQNELVVGSENGNLALFKGENKRPIRTASDLGMVTAIAVGDLLNVGRNVLVVVTGCGYVYIYDFEGDVSEGSSERLLQPMHAQRIPANVKVLLIEDVNGDGFYEMVVALTDRVVRTYRWVRSDDCSGDKPVGKLVGLNKWELAEQIGSITPHKDAQGHPSLLVAQPGGTYFSLLVRSANPDNGTDTFDESTATYEPLASARLRNPNIDTEICGNLKEGSGETAFAVATLDGTLMLVRDGKIRSNLQVDHQLFALFGLDVTGDGNDEVVACAWDGNTYIVTHSGEAVRYTFDEPVSTFTAGYYGHGGTQVPCLVYATFNNRIFLYHDIRTPHIGTVNLTDLLMKDPQYMELIKKIGVQSTDPNVIRQLNHFLLYGMHNIKITADKTKEEKDAPSPSLGDEPEPSDRAV
ncbi:KICSTOR complex protein ITFG2-like [Oratosquilla oratoria]|uniref:KICSTOR complex protein ITFG2-like n=1 Tax=Oratosquilla oratoria TaxID=337810 RepID=UPI003F75C2BD